MITAEEALETMNARGITSYGGYKKIYVPRAEDLRDMGFGEFVAIAVPEED